MTLNRIFSDGTHMVFPRIFDVINGETQKVTWPWMLPAVTSKIWPSADHWSIAALNDAIDDLYFGRSGNKFISPFVYDNGGGFDEYGLVRNSYKLSQRLYVRFVQKWTHLLDLYIKEYDPLHSYSLTEATQRAGTDTDTGTVGVSGSGSNSVTKPIKSNSSQRTNTPNITETLTGTDTDIYQETTSGLFTPDTVKTNRDHIEGGEQTNKFGFNTPVTGEGADGVPTMKGMHNEQKVSTEELDGTETTSGSVNSSLTRGLNESRARTGSEQEAIQSTESYSGPETASSTKAETETRNLSRSTAESVNSTKMGNMFKSPATLLDDDRSFWFLDYLELVFDDVDALLTLDIYSESEIQTYVW